VTRRSVSVLLTAAAAVVAVGVLWISRRGGELRPQMVDTTSIVMLGDSITAEGDWADLLPHHRVVNAGRPGFTTAELVPLARAVSNGQPRLLVLLTGTNDIRDGRGPLWTRRYIDELVGVVRENSPATRIVLQSVLPRADRSDEVVATNEVIRTLAEELDVQYLDLYPVFDNGEGALRASDTRDGLHLTDAGYDRWVEVLRPVVDPS
jgi:lysophospholipase L1-like esterase